MRDVGKGPWREGPPPSEGLWPASYLFLKNPRHLRFFSKERGWSIVMTEETTLEAVARRAGTIAALPQQSIVWRERADWWPERSRTQQGCAPESMWRRPDEQLLHA